MIKSLLGGVLAAAALVGAPAAHAQSMDLFSPADFSAWVDVRLSHSDGERGWLNGGFGKLRYSGTGTKTDLAQAALLWRPHLSSSLSGYVLWQAVPDARKSFGMEEGYLQWRPVPTSDLRYSARLGQMFVPVSMEHDGRGWTVQRTLTPSAINSWVGEELIVRGAEFSVQKAVAGSTLGLTTGVFTRDDTAGTLLSWRGWALHDVSSADNTELPLPDGANQGYARLFGTYQATASRPLVEEDGRLGYYVRLDWRAPAAIAINAEFYDNQGDPTAVRNGQWGWATRFYNVGVNWQMDARNEWLAQYMSGTTATGWQVGQGHRAIDVGYESAYGLLSHRFDHSRLSGRIDWFAAKDFSLRGVDDNGETGYAATVAWIKPVNMYLDIAFEALTVASDRPARATHLITSQQSQSQIQLAFKLHL